MKTFLKVLSKGVFAGGAMLSAAVSAGEWGLGVGVAAQQAPQVGTDPQVVLLPFPSYRGERLTMDFGSVSYAVSQSEDVRISVDGQLRFDGYDPGDSEELGGLKERDLTLDAGLSLRMRKPWGTLNFRFLTDTLGVHDGYEFSAAYEYPVTLNRWTLVPSLGVTMPSDDMVDYYYGVRPGEATSRRPSYKGSAVINTTIGATVLYELSDRWQVMGGGQYTDLGDEITDSPIIERDYQMIVYSAIVYRF